jgi:histidine triad (HIT) family protein
MNECVFCKIIKEEIPSRVVYQTDDVICFLPNKIEVFGHTLIVPKEHFADLYSIPEHILEKLVDASKKLAIAYKEKIDATGANLMHASGKDGEQSVFHFHFHLLPRFKDDGLKTWPQLPKIDVDADDLLSKLKLDR